MVFTHILLPQCCYSGFKKSIYIVKNIFFFKLKRNLEVNSTLFMESKFFTPGFKNRSSIRSVQLEKEVVSDSVINGHE